MKRNIPLFKIYWDEQDIDMVNSVIRKGLNWSSGPEIKEFEKMVADYVGVEYTLAVNSGTSALHAILIANGLGHGDEIIVPSFTFIATANAALFVGAKPIFAEIESQTYGLDPNDIENKITTKTKAIIPVHYGGLSCQIEKIRDIAKRHNLILIEDAAESLGAMVNGKRVGSFGDAAILSFCGPKVITTGEGGMVLTNSSETYEKLKLVCSHGRAESSNYFTSAEQMDYVTLGYNFRMPTMNAALGIAQITKIAYLIEKRQNNANHLSEVLEGIEGLQTPKVPDGYFHVRQMYTISVADGKGTRDNLKKYLAERGIMSRVYFDPVHLSVFYKREFGYKGGELPITEAICNNVLTLPLFPQMSHEEVEYVADALRHFFSRR